MRIKNKWKVLAAFGILCAMIIAILPSYAQYASGINPELYKTMSEEGPVYVNTKVPGMHKEYDAKYGCEVWKNGRGDYVCRDENMHPLHDIDKNVFFNGDKNNPDVRKEWDPERECYVWRSFRGDFLGRDKPTEDQEKKWLNDTSKDWKDNGNYPKGNMSKDMQDIVRKEKEAIMKMELNQYKAMEERTQNEQKVDDEAIALNKKKNRKMMEDEGSGEGNSSKTVRYEDVDYAQIERALSELDRQVNNMSAELRSAQAELQRKGEYAKYKTVVANAQMSLNHYRQRRQNTRDQAQMLRLADSSVIEIETQLDLIYSELVRKGTVNKYGGIVTKLKNRLGSYKKERSKISI